MKILNLELKLISVVINTYNAEKHLGRVLESVKDFDEVLVVDNESSDRTVEIARSHGATVLTKPRNGHTIVEPHRQWAIEHARGPWVLVVDADEVVPEALRQYLYEHIKEQPGPHALLLPLRNFFMGREMHCLYPEYILRFFAKEGTEWPPTVHSRPSHAGPLLKIPRRRRDLALIHLANDTMGDLMRKLNVYTEREVPRRRQRYRRWQMLTAPTFRFFKRYILKGGWRDGMPGFIRAVYDATYRFTIMAKIEESKKNL